VLLVEEPDEVGHDLLVKTLTGKKRVVVGRDNLEDTAVDGQGQRIDGSIRR